MPEAFHLYSMRQAIDEGFILDVVTNYTTYATYYRLVKAGVRSRHSPASSTSPWPGRGRRIARGCSFTFSLRWTASKAMEDEPQRSEFREKLNGHLNIYSFMSQIVPYGDAALEMLYSYGRFLLPHLPLDRDTEPVKINDEVGLQYYRLQRISSGEISLREGDPEGVKSPTDVGTGKARDEKVPLSEIIEVLNDRVGTEFTEEDRFSFEQIREKAIANDQVVKLR